MTNNKDYREYLLTYASLGSIAAGYKPSYCGPVPYYSILASRILELEAQQSITNEKYFELKKKNEKQYELLNRAILLIQDIEKTASEEWDARAVDILKLYKDQQ